MYSLRNQGPTRLAMPVNARPVISNNERELFRGQNRPLLNRPLMKVELHRHAPGAFL